MTLRREVRTELARSVIGVICRSRALFLLWRLAGSLLPDRRSSCGHGGNPRGTELCDPTDQPHGDRFVQWEVDGSLSLLIVLELLFERGEECARCRKQRIVLLKSGEV